MVVGANFTYSQAGVIRFYGWSSNHTFAEDWYSGEADYVRTVKDLSGSNVIQTCNTTQYYDYLLEYANGVNLQTTNYSPTCMMTQPWNIQFYDEVLHASSDAEGVSTAQTHFDTMETQSVSDDQFHSALPGFVQKADNPSTKPDLNTYCQTNSLSCDTFSHQQSNYTMDVWTSNPH